MMHGFIMGCQDHCPDPVFLCDAKHFHAYFKIPGPIINARQQMGMNIHIFHAVSPRHVKYVCCIFVPYIVNNIFRKISYFAKWLESIEKQDGFPSC